MSEPQATGSAQARSAGRAVLIISAVLACMVLVIIASRWLLGGSMAVLSVALPVVGLLWLAGLGLKMWRTAPVLDAAPQRGDRPSRRVPRFEPAPRSDRPSDSGGHVSA